MIDLQCYLSAICYEAFTLGHLSSEVGLMADRITSFCFWMNLGSQGMNHHLAYVGDMLVDELISEVT